MLMLTPKNTLTTRCSSYDTQVDAVLSSTITPLSGRGSRARSMQTLGRHEPPEVHV